MSSFSRPTTVRERQHTAILTAYREAGVEPPTQTSEALLAIREVPGTRQVAEALIRQAFDVTDNPYRASQSRTSSGIPWRSLRRRSQGQQVPPCRPNLPRRLEPTGSISCLCPGSSRISERPTRCPQPTSSPPTTTGACTQPSCWTNGAAVMAPGGSSSATRPSPAPGTSGPSPRTAVGRCPRRRVLGNNEPGFRCCGVGLASRTPPERSPALARREPCSRGALLGRSGAEYETGSRPANRQRRLSNRLPEGPHPRPASTLKWRPANTEPGLA
jgi:hypothetical protein